MSIFGVSMVRDESDIIGWTLPRMAVQLDHVIVADNLSKDDTRVILERVAGRLGNITIVRDDEPAYLQSEKMTRLAEMARSEGADWVVPFDADEIWDTGLGPINEFDMPSVPKIAVTLHDHVVTSVDDQAEEDVCVRMACRRVPQALGKVACRTLPGLVIDMGNHNAHYPGFADGTDLGWVIHHYPYRSVEQFARKARNGKAAYDAAGDRLGPDTGRHWREYGRFLEDKGIAAIEEIFTTWFHSDDPVANGLLCDCTLPPMP